MENIKEVKDILQFILRADEIERDVSVGSDIISLYMIFRLKSFWLLQKMKLHLEQKKGL